MRVMFSSLPEQVFQWEDVRGASEPCKDVFRCSFSSSVVGKRIIGAKEITGLQ